MLSLVVVGSLLAVSPPALPTEPAPAPAVVEGSLEAPAEGPAEAPADGPADSVDAIVITPVPGALPEAFPARPPAVDPATTPPRAVVVVEQTHSLGTIAMVPPPRVRAVPPVPWSGAGRFVGGSVMLVAGTGLLLAATLEFANGRDTTQPVVSQVPAGISMLVAGGIMIGTGARDQQRLSEWEADTHTRAQPSGNGLIIGGVTATTLGAMAAIATAVASDMDLNAPRSIPAGWATAGVALGGGTALMIAGIVRRKRYGKWRDGLHGVPMVAPTRAGATLGYVGRF